jgi:NAD(P)H-hydrate epimerase
MKLVTVDQMKAIEKEADEKGLSYSDMMENAGRELAYVIADLPYFDAEDDEASVLALVGPGNNGGDALVALTHLAADGWTARAYLVKRKVKGDELIQQFNEMGGEVLEAAKDENYSSLRDSLANANILVDGLLGTGIKLPLKEDIAGVLAAVNAALDESEDPPLIVAVDCPSGVDCSTGAAAPETLPVDLTVTMGAVKDGMLKFPAHELMGDLIVADIGLHDKIKSWTSITRQVAEEDMVAALLPARPSDAHKGTFGTALIAAGSINYTGAAYLAGMAAYRSGVGLVTMAVPAPLHTSLAGQFPEATWILLPHEQGVISAPAAEVLTRNLERATALLIGPGFGLEDPTRDFIANFLDGKSATRKGSTHIGFLHEANAPAEAAKNNLPPLVFDADGLKLLAKLPGWPKKLPALSVLTPHPGEMSVLTGLPVDEIQSDREGIAARFANEWGHVVVLKGAFTVIAAPDGRTTVIPVASAALARAGTGDVLAGLIVGLRAQGLEAYEAAVAGAWIHARAGLEAAEALGGTTSVLAGDLLDSIPDVMSDLE